MGGLKGQGQLIIGNQPFFLHFFILNEPKNLSQWPIDMNHQNSGM